MDDWRGWEFKDCFKIQLPADSTPRLDEDGTTAVIRIGNPGDVTEVLLSNYPLQKGASEEKDLMEALREILTEFFGESFRESFGHLVPFHVEPVEDPDLKASCAQGVAVLQDARDALWIARVYARPGEPRFWLMHWNGPRGNLETVMRIFVSFEPEDSSFS